VILKEGGYYALESPPGFFMVFGVSDVENWPVCVPLADGDAVVCSGFVHRKGSNGKGRYARLLHTRDGRVVSLYHRVSRLNSGSGTWRELAPLEVLAMADGLPTV
jgi:hypothetical protein